MLSPMNTQSLQPDEQERPLGLILEEIGEGWIPMEGGRWKSPQGEVYVGIDLASSPDLETRPPQL